MSANIEADLLARIDTGILWQPFLERINTMLNAAATRGFRYVATCGYRSYADQDRVYAEGRTTGNVGHVKTRARGGESPHQFYCAIDFALDASPAPGLQPDYEHFQTLAEEAKRAGLESGYYWGFRDPPHVQAPVKAWGLTWSNLDRAYRQGGRDAVIALLDSVAGW